MVSLLCLLFPGAAAADSFPATPAGTVTTNGAVLDFHRDGDTVWLAGTFSRVASVVGNAAIVDDAGRRAVATPDFGGRVAASVPDGTGGWYVGGSFTRIDGNDGRYVVRLRPDGSIDPAFRARPNGPVRGLALHDGRLYVAGTFSRIGGGPQAYLARVSPATGVIDASWRPRLPGVGERIAFEAGRAFVTYTSIEPLGWGRGQFDPGFGVVALDLVRGRAISGFRAAFDRFSGVRALAAGNGRVYLGGESFVAALDARTGRRVARWESYGRGRVDALALSGTVLYAGGRIEDWSGRDPFDPNFEEERGLVVLDAITGRPTGTLPRLSAGSVSALAVEGSTLYVGGRFANVRVSSDSETLLPRSNVAAFNAASGEALDWAPDVGGEVHTLSAGPSGVFIGGEFTTLGGVRRDGIAAIDAVTGEVRDGFAPGIGRVRHHLGTWGYQHTVNAIRRVGDRVYVGGAFGSLDGVRVENFAALDPITGALDRARSRAFRGSVWNIDAGRQGRILVSGQFQRVDSQRTGPAAVLDASSGRLTAWRPPRRFQVVHHLLEAGGRIWVGGTARRGNSLAATLPSSGRELASPVVPGQSGAMQLAASGRRLFVAGRFTDVSTNPDPDVVLEYDMVTNRRTRTWRLAGRGGTSWSAVTSLSTDGRYLAITRTLDFSRGPGEDALDQLRPGYWTRFHPSRITTQLRVLDLRTGRTRRFVVHPYADNWVTSGAVSSYSTWGDVPGESIASRAAPGVYEADIADGRLYAAGDFVGIGSRVQPFFAAFQLLPNAVPSCSGDRVGTLAGTAVTAIVRCEDRDQPQLAYRVVSLDGGTATVGLADRGIGGRVAFGAPTIAGEYHVVVEARDRHGATATAMVTVDVHAPAVPPTCADIDLEVRDDVPTRIDLACLGWDAGLSWAIAVQPAHGRLNQFDAARGTVRYIPRANYAGLDTFGFTVSNGTATSAMVTVRLTVLAVRGTSGNDQLTGGHGNDRIDAGAGNDAVQGGGGADHIDGDRGNDRLLGGAGRDTVLGGPGDDVVLAVDGARDVVGCGAGADTAVVDRRDRVVGCEVVRRR